MYMQTFQNLGAGGVQTTSGPQAAFQIKDIQNGFYLYTRDGHNDLYDG